MIRKWKWSLVTIYRGCILRSGIARVIKAGGPPSWRAFTNYFRRRAGLGFRGLGVGCILRSGIARVIKAGGPSSWRAFTNYFRRRAGLGFRGLGFRGLGSRG